MTRDRDALYVRLHQSQRESSFVTNAALQSTGIEVSLAYLRYVKGDFTHSCRHRLGLATIGMFSPMWRPLIGLDAQICLSLSLHGYIQHNADQFRQNVKSLPCNLFQDFWY